MRLDLGCGPNKEEGYIGMDKTQYEGVDIVHDIEDTPWPVDDDTYTHVIASHVLEHVKPWKIIDVMNELWRVTQHKCEVDIRTPYGDYFRFDPTHCIHFIAPSWLYFDPTSEYYDCYKPKPWKVMQMQDDDKLKELHATMRKIKEEPHGQ